MISWYFKNDFIPKTLVGLEQAVPAGELQSAGFHQEVSTEDAFHKLVEYFLRHICQIHLARGKIYIPRYQAVLSNALQKSTARAHS